MVVPTNQDKRLVGNAKLISEDEDETMFPFKFQGRFLKAEQAFSLSYADSCKIDNSLLWLMQKKAFHHYGLYFLIWNTLAVLSSISSPFGDDDDTDRPILAISESYAKQIKLKMMGLRNDVLYKQDQNIVLLGIEVPCKARISISYYEEMGGKEYLDRLETWYSNCWWLLRRYNRKKALKC